MRRTLKRGETYKAKDGTIYMHDRDGKGYHGTVKGRHPHVDGKGNPLPLEFEINEEEFRKDPSIWVPMPEEVAAAKAARLKQENEWHANRIDKTGKPSKPSDELLASIGCAENKMVVPPEESAAAKKRSPMAVKG